MLVILDRLICMNARNQFSPKGRVAPPLTGRMTPDNSHSSWSCTSVRNSQRPQPVVVRVFWKIRFGVSAAECKNEEDPRQRHDLVSYGLSIRMS